MLNLFKVGAYRIVREEYDPLLQEMIPRKYFSGGMDLAMGGVAAGRGVGSE